MISFKPVTLSDRGWADKLLRYESIRSADINFTNIYLWGPDYCQGAAEVAGRFTLKSRWPDGVHYLCPVGSGSLAEAIRALKADAEEQGETLKLWCVPTNIAAELDGLFPGAFAFFPNRDIWDYLYRADRLSELTGKHLHAKRNHINSFTENNRWSFEAISRENIPLCLDMAERWVQSNDGKSEESGYAAEHAAIRRALSEFEALGLEGGLLKIDQRVVAFTVGEVLCHDTYVVHFEKAFSEIRGAYPMINREFVRHICREHPEMAFINREDDMGLDYLRKAKLSYDPDFMEVKLTAVLRAGATL